MLKYTIKRSITSILIFFGISIMVFALIHMQPGNPYSGMLNPDVTPEIYENMLRQIGYYDPMPVKYIKWLGRAIRGDFGYSLHYKSPVLSVINSRIWNSFLLAFLSSLISTTIAIAAGVFSAAKHNSIFDYIVTIICFIGISIPSFFFGLLMIKAFAFDLKILPISGMVTIGEHYTGFRAVLDIGKHMILPVIVLSFIQTASMMRYTRSSMLNVLKKDYMRTARAKGLNFNKAIWKHGFRNALMPIITILCLQIPSLFSGALITETIFVWPGIGRLNYDAVLNRDYPLIMGILMILTILILISNLLADILYAVIDPRIQYD